MQGSGNKTAIRRWEPFAVFTVTVVLLAFLVPRVQTYLSPITGDEPFYLMTALSILEDGDLNECNNYRQTEERRIYPAYYSDATGKPRGWRGWAAVPFPLPPHPALLQPPERMCVSTYGDIPLPADGSGDELYSKHGLALTLLVLPAFALGGLPWVQYFLVALAALLAANVYLLSREVTSSGAAALLTWAAFSLTVPLLPYSFLIFPELPAALLVVYAFRRARHAYNNPMQVAVAAAAVAFLPWLHYRFAPVSVALALCWLFSIRRSGLRQRRSHILAALGMPLGSAALLMAFFHERYGQVVPNASDHAGSSDVAGTLRGAAGLLFDEQWGLLTSAPIYLLATVGVALMIASRRWRAELGWIAAIALPYYVVIANYGQWWGEWCPPARYLVSILPVLAVPFAVVLDRVPGWGYRLLYAVLMGVSLLMVWGYLYQPQWMYNHPSPDGTNRVFTDGLPMLFEGTPLGRPASGLGWAVSDMLPSFVLPYFYSEPYSSEAWRLAAFPGALSALVVALGTVLAWRAIASSRARSHVDHQPLSGQDKQAPGEDADLEAPRSQVV